ncbi:adenylyl-sulfate kinase [Paraburkholderia aspalathi]|nr:adenylyl-sulfate kinase [Paraburkholderia aspalathi]
MKQQRPLVVWFTGMSGAGKSTLASLLEEELRARGLRTFLLVTSR